MSIRRALGMALWLAIVLSSIAACFGGGGEKLTVLAGSELKDLEPFFEQIQRETGVQLEMKYTGTLDGADQLTSGVDVDLAWFSHAKYLTLLESVNSRIRGQEKIMLSPVVLGVKESKARAWGWIDNPEITWEDIAAKAAAGELRFAMTNPAASNSGFTALVGVASALSGTSDALQVEDIKTEALQGFFKGQALTAGSSGWLADAYVREQANLDGIVNYESVLLALNKSHKLTEPLYLVYPRDGIITADYPLMLINPDKREAYQKLVDYLRSTDMQRLIMERTLRRPINPQVQLSSDFANQILVELPFPNSVAVIDSLIYGYLDEQRIPSHTFYVLDVSGSMEGDRLDALKTALHGLTGLDNSLTGQFSRFRSRERVTLIPFSDHVEDVRFFTVDDPAEGSASMDAIRQYVSRLQAGGGTAIYTSLELAYSEAQVAYGSNPDRYYSVVLMSDGENNEGASLGDFRRYYQGLPAELQQIRTFTILFGNANAGEMREIAELTGGRVFDAQHEALSAIFKDIRGYQ